MRADGNEERLISPTLSDRFKPIRLHLHRRSLADEIQPQQNRRHPVPLFHPALDSLQRAAFDPNTHPLPNRWRQPDPYTRFQSQQYVLQLALKSFLIENVQQICHMVVLANRVLLCRFTLNEDISREKRLLEHDRFAAILMCRVVARQGRADFLPNAIFDNFFLSTGFAMRYVPANGFGHPVKILEPRIDVNMN